MTLSIWDTFVALVRRSEGNDEESESEEDEGQFVPSTLDLSVRVAHGGTDDERLRALSKIDEQTKELEQQQHEN